LTARSFLLSLSRSHVDLWSPRAGLRLFEERLAAAEVQTLKAGALFLKHVKSGSPHPRFVYLSDDGAALQWVEEKDKAKRKDAKEIRLAELTDIHKGHATPVFSGKYAKETNAECCFSLVSPDRSLDVQCDDARTRDFWVNALVRLSAALRRDIAVTTNSPATPFASVGDLGSSSSSSSSSRSAMMASMMMGGGGASANASAAAAPSPFSSTRFAGQSAANALQQSGGSAPAPAVTLFAPVNSK
jgi:hypothetical protein